jgi:hypothetical protein
MLCPQAIPGTSEDCDPSEAKAEYQATRAIAEDCDRQGRTAVDDAPP